MHGIILKGIGSFYTVKSGNAEYVCKARGKFRKQGICPVPGDNVEFDFDSKTKNGFISEICKRKNELIRPAVANIDKLMIVVSASIPKPDFYLVDKLSVLCEINKIEPIIVINKCDEQCASESISLICSEYKNTGYKIITVSAATGQGMELLKNELNGSTVCFAGQSAVGKSSILNALMPQLTLETGGLSRKNERGRHTTRHAELWINNDGSGVFDTPGFSLIELSKIEPNQLAEFYPEMKMYRNQCRFTGCSHINEPDCAVKSLLDTDKISLERYNRYKDLYYELLEAYKHRFD